MSEQISEPTSRANLSKWAPIIYGRTYAVDFRFIVTPDNFQEEHKKVAWEYIKITTRAVENLPGKPRWLFLRTNKNCVVGVTCMVRDLIGSYTSDESQDLTRDKLGRPLYAFVGYASEDSMPSGIPAMKLELFTAPYKEFVSQKWQEDYTDLGSNQDTPQNLKSNYVKQFNSDELATPDAEKAQILIDSLIPLNDHSIIFWNINEAKNIWFTASQDNEPLSICFGNLTRRDLIDSKFMNAVIDEVESRQEDRKVENAIIYAEPQRPLENRRDSVHNLPSSSSVHPEQAKVNSQRAESDVNRQQVERRSNIGFRVIVNLSKLGRNAIESLRGVREARKADGIMLNTLGQIARPILGDEAVDEIYMEVAELDLWEQRLRNEIDIASDNLYRLEEEIEQLRRQGRIKEFEQKRFEASKIRQEIDEAKQDLEEVIQVIDRVRKSHSQGETYSAQSRQVDSKFRPDPNYGFKEKAKTIIENEQSARPISDGSPSNSKDIWEL